MDNEAPSPVTLGGTLLVIALAMASVGFNLMSEDGWFPILDSANLALHEAGHPLISILSQRATVYGGTLFQLIFPMACAWHFYRIEHVNGVGISMIWLAENTFNIARYMADARAQILPLVGNGEHDWAEIFSRWGVLQSDTMIAGTLRGIGLLLIIATIAWMIKQWRQA
jgi:hypothetical protein